MIVAAIQMTSGSDKQKNWEKAARFAAEAAAKKAELIVLPEHWDWLGPVADKKAMAEGLEGPSLHFIRELAKKYHCYFVAGSIGEKNGDKPPYNTSVLICPDGKLGKAYRKIHLFDTLVAGGHKESDVVSAGGEIMTPSPIEGEGRGEGCNVGIAICYDLRFPELFQKMSQQGADLFVLPSNFTAVTGVAHWEVLVRARAIENQCFLIACDQTGMTGAGWEAHGHSMIVDPWGEILAGLGKEEGVITAVLDFSKLAEIRQKMPVFSHRKLGPSPK